jgi:hypothetical protein
MTPAQRSTSPDRAPNRVGTAAMPLFACRYSHHMTDSDVKWIVRRSDVLPAVFLLPDGTWGSRARARSFDTVHAAMLTAAPAGTTAIPRRLTYQSTERRS